MSRHEPVSFRRRRMIKARLLLSRNLISTKSKSRIRISSALPPLPEPTFLPCNGQLLPCNGRRLRPPPHQLRVSPKFAPAFPAELRQQVLSVFAGLPMMFGNPIYFELRPELTAHWGKLLSGAGIGVPVHAAAFIRKRMVVLEADLFSQAEQLRLILVHEIFHFAWVRLSNGQRRAFTDLLTDEIQDRARGELGEAAGVKKRLFQESASFDGSSRLWRDYACESFCDSGAAFFSGAAANEHFTLAKRWAGRRYAWLLRTGEGGWRC